MNRQQGAGLGTAAVGAAILAGTVFMAKAPNPEHQSPPLRTAPLEVAAQPISLEPDGFIYYVKAQDGHVHVVTAGAPGQPVELTPPPAVPCNGSRAGQSFGFWLCPSNVTQWTAQPWAWIGPPPLVPCSQALRGESRNGYVCSKDRASGRYRVWIPVQR